MPSKKKTRVEVADDNIFIRITPTLKRDFQKALEAHPDLSTMTAFVEDCIKALILQMRRGEHPAYPVEFVVKSEEGVDGGRRSRGKKE